MRDLYSEYKIGLISWDTAYFIANNLAATISENPSIEYAETDYWAKQMESLGIDAAERIMSLLGYTQDENGLFSDIH